ncbi:MAG: response regulator [Candidatus Aceula meridiana]|nr:response regulator [Candidatus Aceula meridiana]
MKTILVVDDKERIRRTYNSVFTKEGYRVLEASNADEANDVVTSNKIDLMLLDIEMPDVNGTILYDVTKLFRKDLNIIVSSVYSLDDQRFLIKNADDYFDKSEGIKVLKEKVSRALSNGKHKKDETGGGHENRFDDAG